MVTRELESILCPSVLFVNESKDQIDGIGWGHAMFDRLAGGTEDRASIGSEAHSASRALTQHPTPCGNSLTGVVRANHRGLSLIACREQSALDRPAWALRWSEH
jgi:hypothetical protein